MDNNYVLGLDVGITSIGWSIMDVGNDTLTEMGVHLFDEATSASESRLNRSARRTIRRRKWRKQQLKNAFVEFGLISKEKMAQNDFLSFTVDKPKDETVYHLRKRALEEQVTLRELLLALYNICGTRGHFLMETIDFTKDTITYDYFVEQFHEFVKEYVRFNEDTGFDDSVLKPLFENGKLFKADIKKLIKDEYTLDDEDSVALIEILYLICGYTAKLKDVDESVIIPEFENKKSVKIDDLLKQQESLNEFLNNALEIHDLIAISQILKSHNYLCEIAVEKLDGVHSIYKLKEQNPEEYKKIKTDIQNKMSKPSGDRLRVVKNMENKYPNGLYVKEASAILHKQQEYYPELITDNFIEVCIATIKARIPYYIGPLSKNAKNSWIEKTGSFKYSYEYSKDQSVNEEVSIREWKDRMRSRCTYLPECFALPKGSFVAETFNIVNELNILRAEDKNGDSYYLTREDKIKIFDQLLLNNHDYTMYDEIKEVLNLGYFGPQNRGRATKLKNKYTLYFGVIQSLPHLKLHSILDLFVDRDRVEKIEDIILNLNLFDEEKSKENYFVKEAGLSIEDAKVLSKYKSNGFYSFSKEFLMDVGMNQNQESLLEELFGDNPHSDSEKNEQMTLITRACDVNGNPIYFDSNKYLDKLQKSKGRLSVDLLMDDGKPFIPISRPVIRALNECFKLYEEIIRVYGVPGRVVIETARDLKDSNRTGEVPAKHFDEMKKLHEYLLKQIAEKKKEYKISAGVESWDTLESYVQKNRQKMELYIRQNGRDLITGDKLDINHLENYEIDHILPRGFGDDSMDNKMLIHRNINAKKADRVPLEYIENEVVTDESGNIVTSSIFKARVYQLFDMKLISEKKKDQLLLASTEDAMGFINRNLVDTRYIIRELIAILNAYNSVNHYKTHIVSLKAAFTSIYRKAFSMQKNRDVGDQHHAHDATIVVLADQVLSTYYPNYDLRGNNKSYHELIKKIVNIKENESEKSENQKLLGFIRRAYFKRFGNYPNDNDSIVSKMKDTVPLYSYKVNHNYKGAFFDATIYSPKKNDKGVLGLLGVNNDKHVFSAINCVAVDIYKYTTTKGLKKHVAIHIPKVIVDENGNINKEKYITLIKDFYKVPELLDEEGNIKEYYFRMRLFKNDLVYDTKNYTVQKFNIGSIVNKKLELKHIYVFSYNDIYKRVYFYKKELATQFDFKLSKINPDGKKKFSDYKIQEIIDYSIDNLMDIDDVERYRKSIEKELSSKKKYQEFLEMMAYLDLIVNRNCTPPTIIGQYLPVAGSIDEKEDNNSHYIKIKSSILGVRYTNNENGKLIISGPKKAPQLYSKIKKEDFSWNVSSDVLE